MTLDMLNKIRRIAKVKHLMYFTECGAGGKVLVLYTDQPERLEKYASLLQEQLWFVDVKICTGVFVGR